MIDEPVGREPEIAFLEAFLDQPDHALRAITLVGDPGIGKSTLWQHLVEAGRSRSLAVLASRPAETERELEHLVLGDLFRDLDRSLFASLPAPRRRALESALLMADPDGTVDRRALGVAVATVLEAMSETQPVLIAIDDDQWIDASSAAALEFAFRRLLDRPIRVLLARRRGGHGPLRIDALVPGNASARLEIGPLSIGATQLLLRDRLGLALSRPTLRELHHISAGNPFHALELGRARSRDVSRDLALPPPVGTVDALLEARLRDLDPPVRRALLLVAAHGRMSPGFLAMLGVPDRVVDQAISASLLVRSTGSLGFAHPLLASAVYEGAGTEMRQAAHRQLAEALDDVVQRGRHLALGAAGPSARIATELEAAADVARQRGQSVAAADLVEHAVRLTPADDVDDHHRRLLAAARARLEAGDGERGRELLASLLERVPPGPWRAETLFVAAILEPAAKAVAQLEEALHLAGSEPRLGAGIHAAMAVAGRVTHGRLWAEEHAETSLRLTESLDDDALRARALSAAAMLRFEGADPSAAELAQAAYDLAAQVGDDAVRREAATTVGHIATWSGDGDWARSWLLDQLALWRDRDEMVQAECLWYLAMVELRAGRWTEASSLSDQAIDIRTQYGMELPPDHLPPALIALHQGDFELARRHSERALALADRMLLPVHLSILGTVELWTDNRDGAITWFDRAEEAADVRGLVEPALRAWRPDEYEALLRSGRVDEAEQRLADWEAQAIRLGRKRERAGAARVRGLIAAARGDLPAAERLLEDAATRHEDAGDPFGLARCRLALGVVHRRLRRKRLARAALEAAVQAFDALGAASWLAEARAELARIGGRERIEGMSPSEQRVAELVAEGRTNRDIAAALFLTERTVASHLTHAYAKLGVRSRTELARVMHTTASNIPKS
jgi:DNA-binding CsgD family transcriptional regulator